MEAPASIGLAVVGVSVGNIRPFLSVLPFLAIANPMGAGDEGGIMRTYFEGIVIHNSRGRGYNAITVEQTDGKRFFFTVKSQPMREGWKVKGSGIAEREMISGSMFLATVRVSRINKGES